METVKDGEGSDGPFGHWWSWDGLLLPQGLARAGLVVEANVLGYEACSWRSADHSGADRFEHRGELTSELRVAVADEYLRSVVHRRIACC